MSRGTPLQKGVIYLVDSRRLGHSLGINASGPGKACNLSCCYCQYAGKAMAEVSGAGFFPEERVVREARKAIDENRAWLDYVTFSGNGEPTLHPDFPSIAERVRQMVKPCGKPLAILTNSSTACRPEIRQALGLFDRRFMKLDAGSEEWFGKINRPACTTFRQVMDGLLKLGSFTIQTMLFRGGIGKEGNCAESNIASLIERYKELGARTREIHLYTAERESGGTHVEEVPFEELKGLARTVHDETGIRTIAFYGGRSEPYG